MKLSLILTIFICLSAQTNDMASWNSLSLKTDLTKKFSIKMSQEFRFDDNISHIDKYHTDFGLEYSISKAFSIGSSYRFIRNQNSKEDYKIQNRLSFDLNYETRFDQFKLSSRIRIQNKWDEFDDSVNHIRNKLSLKYKTESSSLNPYFAIESYYKFGESKDSEFSKMRYTLGGTVLKSNYGKLNVFYRIQNELNVKKPDTDFIFGLKYAIEL